MRKPDIPADEATRLEALRDLNILDTPAEERFDRITRVAMRHFGVPMALVSLVDADRQWFKSRQGLDALETPRDISFCGHAILADEILYVPNALDDARFADNPFVTDSPNVRFYAGAPLHAPTGECIGTLCIIDYKPRTFTAVDMTILRDLADCAESELARVRIAKGALEAHRFKQILDRARDMIFMFDANSLQFVYLNQGAVQSMGYSQQELLQLHPFDIKPQIPETPFRRLIEPLLSGELDILIFETTHRRKDGFEFPVEVYLQLVREGKNDGRFVAIVRDISARNQVELELKSVTAMRQAILDSANFSIIATDTKGVITVFNQGAQRMLGYSESEMVGNQTPAILHLPEEIVARAKALSLETGRKVEPGFDVFVMKSKQGYPDENEWSYVRKNGEIFPVLLSVTALFDDSSRIFGYLGVAYDLIERKRVDKMKREFISTVSHELRTPLTSIRGALGLVAGGASGVLPEKALDLVNIAKNNCDRLVRLINDILDMEKIESGKMQFTMLPIDAQSLIGEAVDATQAYAYQRQVKIEIAVGADNAEISGDRDRLLQVLTNLLSNASKFSPPGGTVTVSTSAENGEFVIRVSDAGPGIPEAFKSRIFQKFSQADSSDTRSKGGTGLGLSISQAIVENHGGQIGFDSVFGDGACFWVRLPARQRVPASDSATGKIRVLIVEDDQDIAKLLKIMLERAGYAVDVALSLVQARELLGSTHYSAITLDLLLPGESGLAFVEELRQRPETAALPIVVVSAVVEFGPKELNGAAVMVLDWLGKPIDEERLLAAVADAVKKSGGKRRVLHVEDDVDITRVLRAMLEGVAEVDFAPTLNAAHVCLSSVEYAMVILDIGLPDGSGLELLPRLAQQYPSLPVLIFSGQEFDKNEYGHVLASYVKSRSDTEDMVRVIQNHFSQKSE